MSAPGGRLHHHPLEATGRAEQVRRVWVALALILCAIEAVLLLADAGVFGTPRWRFLAWQYGGFWTGLLHGWTPNYPLQPVSMFFSYAFLHSGWQHLCGNVVTLAWLGWQLERNLTAKAFAVLTGLSALGGAAVFGLISTSPRPMVGASGAIMGLVAAWIAADARDMMQEGAARGRIIGMVVLRIGVLVALHLVTWHVEMGSLAWETHLGGFLAATLAMGLLPGLRPHPSDG